MANEDPLYLAWLRRQNCCCCDQPPPCEANHATNGRTVKSPRARGLGQRSHDHDAMPMRKKHHDDLHHATGRFEGWTQDQRRQFQRNQADRYWVLWLKTPEGKGAVRYAPGEPKKAQPMPELEALYADLGRLRPRLSKKLAAELDTIMARHGR